MAHWSGFMVSIKCFDGTAYQGQISSATSSEITLTKAFCNGVPTPQSSIVVRANEIEELKLLEKQEPSASQPPQRSSTITIAKPIAKRAGGRSQSTSEVNSSSTGGGNLQTAAATTNSNIVSSVANNHKQYQSQQSNNTNNATNRGDAVLIGANNTNNMVIANNANASQQYNRSQPQQLMQQQASNVNSSFVSNKISSKPIDIEQSSSNNSNRNTNSTIEHGSNKSGTTPNKKDKSKGKWTKGWKDEECFGSPLDHKINKDFDFEKNLALFDKQAVWDEINSSQQNGQHQQQQHLQQQQKPDVIKNVDNKRTANKYRHDENVIAGAPARYRQITVPKQDFCEYVTDDGLIIPSVSRTLRKKLWEAADRAGLAWDRRVELVGRAATEMSIQLLGGGHRLNPHNSHQFPTVVVLCGPHKQGAAGINAARQLSSHGIHTVVYVVSSEPAHIKKELSLYSLTRNLVAHSVCDLPNFTDLIMVALCEDTDNPKSYPDINEWVSRNKAPVLALDPPSGGTPGIKTKLSLLPALPLPHSSQNGKLYLCNLGFPVDIFNEVGIKYKSPFGSKFFIPLHPRDD